MVEQILWRNVVHHNNAVSASVIDTCDRAETLLSSSIPDLQFNYILNHLQKEQKFQTETLDKV